jgi:acyl-CoA reductase-like NAD-dependent aldehyde dehydrogenase
VLQQVAMQTLRSAFEYQGQKCSACSRVYIPSNLWPKFKVKSRFVVRGSVVKFAVAGCRAL